MSTASLNRKETTHSNKLQNMIPYLPTLVTLIRLVSLPFLISFLVSEQLLFADLLFIFAIGTDLVDGYIARKTGSSSQFGANVDVTVDSCFVGGIFLYFVLSGIYPSWVLLLIAVMFSQYILTSKLFKITFDPVGKYYGSLLYGAIGLTMLFRGNVAENIILYSLLSVSLFTLSTRLIYLLRHKSRRKNL